MKKLREFIWERCQADDKATDEIISAIEGLVPSEESEYTPPTFTSSANLLPKDYVEGWNNCREEMLRRIK